MESGGGQALAVQQQEDEQRQTDAEMSGADISASEDEKAAVLMNGDRMPAKRKVKRADAKLIRERRLKKAAA